VPKAFWIPPPNLQPRERETVDAVFQSEKSIRAEPVESCKLRYFNSFEFFDHTRSTSTNCTGKSPKHSGKRRLRNGTRKNTRFVTTGTKICERLETEIGGLETDKRALALQLQLEDLERKINESAARDFNAELLQRTLRDATSELPFAALTPPEQSEEIAAGPLTLARVFVKGMSFTAT
jgi:hypothetical protein